MKTHLTVHMIANAHLDPVWLWSWQRGSDEALATCRAACDLLDEYPDVVFTRGEAWAYEQVRQFDPPLLARIAGHIAAGRWEATGGWWVQSDTNVPAAEALRMNIRLGRAWFREHLGLQDFPVAYLVDSFGHGSYLPRILQDSGQRYFVMMRPGPHERPLPSALFRWRSPDGAEVLTFRIVGGYLSAGPDLRRHIQRAIDGAPPDIGHVMCFFGVGDHGGGPTRAAVEWIRAQRDFAPGVRLEFSSPTRFFAAVESRREACPMVSGELEPHAIGCYSVCGDLKREVRAAEQAAIDVERLLDRCGNPAEHKRLLRELEEIWRIVCFNQFHDIVTGSSVREAVREQRAQAGEARQRIERLVHARLRAPDGPAAGCNLPGQRLHLVNRSGRQWTGLAEAEVWTDWRRWEHHLEAADGRVVPCQCAASAALTPWTADGIPRLLIPLNLEPDEHRILRIVPGVAEAALAGEAPRFDAGMLENGLLRVELGRWGVMQIYDVARGPGWAMIAAPLSFECRADDSDTWSHGIERYAGPVLGTVEFEAPVLAASGPLRTTARMAGRVGQSPLMLFVSLERGAKVVHLRLDAMYQERQTLLKAVFSPHFGVRQRLDRVAGGWQERALDGKEYALHHAIATESQLVGAMGLILPDSFAVECGPGAVRPTLIRNSLYAYDRNPPADARTDPRLLERPGTDEGPQSIRLGVAIGEAAKPESLEAVLDCYQRPPHAWDDYGGGARLARFE
jgi:alpha-mannosidase